MPLFVGHTKRGIVTTELKSFPFFQPYFCGQLLECRRLGSTWALEEAIRNIEEYYPVVGILENLVGTFQVLEAKLPRFFSGLEQLYLDLEGTNLELPVETG